MRVGRAMFSAEAHETCRTVLSEDLLTCLKGINICDGDVSEVPIENKFCGKLGNACIASFGSK